MNYPEQAQALGLEQSQFIIKDTQAKTQNAVCGVTQGPATVEDVINARMLRLARQMAKLVQFKDNLPQGHLEMEADEHQRKFSLDGHYPF
jgi:hypothetical protein